MRKNFQFGGVLATTQRSLVYLTFGLVKAATLAIPRKIVFASDSSDVLRGSLREVYAATRTVLPNARLTLELKKSISHRRGLMGLTRFLFNLATSKVIIIDDYLPELNWLKLKSSQTVVQLWHAAGAFKRVGYSRVGLPGGPRSNSNLHRGYSHVLCSSPELVEQYAEAFNIDKTKVHALGVPRFSPYFDTSFQEKSKNELCQELGISKQKKIVLVAPTFRGNGQKTARSSELVHTVNGLATKFTDSHVFLIRDHPFAVNRNPGAKLNVSKKSNVYEVSESSREIEPLVAGSDLLVTDYSSIIFEFALLNKPTILFVPDLNEYENTRGLYFPIDEYGYGNLAVNDRQLIAAIRKPKIDEKRIHALKVRHLSSCTKDSATSIVEKLIEPAL
jgi:CDP-glycerol glycerophosphotransferase (TagB/SpsB family)